MRKIILILFIAFSSTYKLWSQSSIFDDPPKDKAEIFAKNLVSSNDKEHGKLTIAPDMKSMYWDYVKLPYVVDNPQRIAYVRYENGEWSSRKNADFNGKYMSGAPCFLDKDKIIFSKMVNIGIDSIKLSSDFWVVEWENGEWTVLHALGFDQFSETMKWSFSISSDGNIYFEDKNYDEGQYGWGIYMSKYVNGKYKQPVLLPTNINTANFDWAPFIAPDESYLLFASNRPGSLGSTDIYIAFRDKNGHWTNPVNMGEKVNSSDLERWPSVSPDGKILFFQRDYIVDRQLKEQDYYWIDAVIIEELKAQYLK